MLSKKNLVMDRMMELYKDGPKCPTWLSNLDLESSEMSKYIDDMMDNVNRDASPGVPYCKLGSKNEQILRDHSAYIKRRVVGRLGVLITQDFDTLTPEQLVQGDFCDPVRVFVKNEPHKLEKIRDNRFRLISSVSLVDNIVERVLNNLLNKYWIGKWETLPAKAGMGFTSEDKKLIAEAVFQNVKPYNLDMSSFDWSVPGFLIDWDADFRALQLGVVGTALHRALMARAYCVSYTMFQTSDGTIMSQTRRGIQLSGSFNTSSTNSNIRNMTALLVDITLDPISMGDDAIDSHFVENAAQKYLSYGFKVKMYEPIGDTFEFCSHLYRRDGSAYALNDAKALMNLVHTDFSVYPDRNVAKRMAMMQFEDDLCEHPQFLDFVEVLDGVGWYAINNE